jgi:queuosine precursor transporter
MNELIFLFHSSFLASTALIALFIGKEALITFIALSFVLANLLVIKQVDLLGFTATATDAFTIGAIFGLNLLNEYFGKKSTKQALIIGFGALALVTIMYQIHLWYLPSIFDASQEHCIAILSASPRILSASFISFFIAQTFEYYFYTALKKISGDKYLVMRNWLTMGSSQLLDTIIFSFLGLYGIVENIGNIVIVSYVIKLAAIAFTTPFIMLSKKIYNKEQTS